MQVALLGLGRMGSMIAEKLMAGGHQIVIWNRSREVLDKWRVEKADNILNQNLQIAYSIKEIGGLLRKPRIVWSMLPAGEATADAFLEVDTFLEPGDILIDGGNSNFKDTEKRAEEYTKKGIKFMGIGVSGGVYATTNGCCIMVGGDKDTYQYITPILDSLKVPNGTHAYFGTGGAGHFVKMVHNGIEYGMMQAIAEGFGIMAQSDYKLNLFDVAKTWQKGSIVTSLLMYTVESAFFKDPTLKGTEGYIGANGEGQWTVDYAKEKGVPVPVIEQSVLFRDRSRYDEKVEKSFVAKVVQAQRHEFGGHNEKKPKIPDPTKQT